METPYQQHKPLILLSRMQVSHRRPPSKRGRSGQHWTARRRQRDNRPEHQRKEIRRPKATRSAMWCGRIINGRADGAGRGEGHRWPRARQSCWSGGWVRRRAG
eukprot:scaffold134303_cov30-Cyclotella_meneghiniana.AAC.1